MTREEVKNLQIGDVYINDEIGFDNEPREIYKIEHDVYYYRYDDKIEITNNYNDFEDLINPNYKLIKKANMNKFKIESGMILITNEEELNHVDVNNIWITFAGKTEMCACCYGAPKWNPINIEDMSICGNKINFIIKEPKATIDKGTLLWKRNNIKEMTISEIEEKLNLIPGSLRIKN